MVIGRKGIDYCPGSNFPIDHILGKMFDLGLSRKDVVNFERLDNHKIVKNLNANSPLEKGKKEDVLKYIDSWLELIEKEEEWV